MQQDSYIIEFQRGNESESAKIYSWSAFFTLLILLLVGAKSYWVYDNYQSSIKAQIQLNLNSLAIDRELMTRMIIDKHKAELQLLAHNEIIENFLLNSKSQAAVLTNLLNSNPAYFGWVLTDKTGIHTFAGGNFPLKYKDRLIKGAENSPEGYSYILERSDNESRVFLLAQQIRIRGMNIGTLIVADRLLMFDELFSDRRTLGMSGESFIADNEGKALTALRYPFHAGHSINAEAMKSCLSGDEQVFKITPDYVDVSTAMAFRQIKGYGGCIMVHIRADEVFAPIVTFRNIAISVNAVIFILVVFIAGIVSRLLIRDINERKKNAELIYKMAFYDTLTQLPNRRLLNDRLTQAMAASKRSNCYCALMFLDLDNFKPLNDTHGHVVGDMLLIEAANRLKSCVREIDTVSRFGGDEFVVMLGELAVDKSESTLQAKIVAEKVLQALSAPYRMKVNDEGLGESVVEHHCTASIGVSMFIDHEASADDIMKWADSAMYQAKVAGRNQIRFYEAAV